MEDFGFSVSLSSIVQRTKPIERHSNSQINERVRQELSKLFGRKVNSWDDALNFVSNLLEDFKSAELEASDLRAQISMIENNSDTDIEEINQRINDLKYQLKLSKDLLKQTEADYTFAQHKKINIIHGDFKGQITVSKAEQKGFLMLSSNNQHALDFLAREIGMEIIPGEATKSDVTRILQASAQQVAELNHMKEKTEKMTEKIKGKIAEIRKRIKIEETRKTRLVDEIADLTDALDDDPRVIYTFPKSSRDEYIHEVSDLKRALALMGIDIGSEKSIDELVSLQKRELLKLARHVEQRKNEERFRSSMPKSNCSNQIKIIESIADLISAANESAQEILDSKCVF